MAKSNDLVFEHYRVVKNDHGEATVLGKGAMGITYKAVDTNLGRDVALKVITPSLLDSDEARLRFQREARAAATLRHRNVASVYHLGKANQSYFYAMEFIEGETIKHIVDREGRLPLVYALKITQQVARALSAAEKYDMVHRDIKPANIMMTPEADGEMIVKLIDFGLAKSARKQGEHTMFATTAGFMGTPSFASPEQFKEETLDIRSDIYSLGITLWYMLEGMPPFSGGLATIMAAHLSAPLPTERLRGLPAPAINLLVKMLEKQPSARPQSAAALLRMISQCIADVSRSVDEFEPLTLPPLSTDTDTHDGESPGDDFAAPGAAPTLTERRPPAVPTGMAPALTEPRGPVGKAPGAPGTRPAQWLLWGAVALFIGLAVGGSLWLASRPGPDPIATKLLHKADQDREDAKWSAAIAGYLRVVHEFAGSGEAQAARTGIDEVVVRLLNTDSPEARVAADRARTGLESIASELGSTSAMMLLGRTLAGEEPGAAADWYAKAAAAYAEAGDWSGAGKAYSGIAGIEPKTDRGREAQAKLQQIVDNFQRHAPGFDDVQFERAVPVLAELGKAGNVQAMLLLGERLKTTRPDDAFAWLKRAAEEYERLTNYPVAISIYARIARLFPGGLEHEFAMQQMADLADMVSNGEPNLEESEFTELRPALVEAAKLGVLPAARLLGSRLRDSDPAEAYTWTLAAAKMGSPPEMVETGLMLSSGLGTKPDWKEAVRWFEKAHAQGDPAGTFHLAECYLEGTGVSADAVKAVELLRTASAKGQAMAMNLLGTLYDNGTGTTADPDEAVRLFQQASDLGYHDATGNLGAMVMRGVVGAKDGKPDKARAIELIKKGAEAGSPVSMYFLGASYEEAMGMERDLKKAAAWYKKAAEADDPNGMYRYAVSLEEGWLAKKDVVEAGEWYRKAATRGHPEAQTWCDHHEIAY